MHAPLTNLVACTSVTTVVRLKLRSFLFLSLSLYLLSFFLSFLDLIVLSKI
jgi:hypothetical protein